MLEVLTVVRRSGRRANYRIDEIADRVTDRDQSSFTVTGLDRRRIRATFETHVPGKWIVKKHPDTPAGVNNNSPDNLYIVERVEVDTASLDDAITEFELAAKVMLDRARDVVRIALEHSGGSRADPLLDDTAPSLAPAEDAFAAYGD